MALTYKRAKTGELQAYENGQLKGQVVKGSPYYDAAKASVKSQEEAASQQQRQTQVAADEDKKAADKAALEEIQKRFEGYTPEQIASVATTGAIEQQETLAKRKSALEGYNAPELAAMQAQMATGQQAGQQQRERALQAALAQRGVQGGAAAALQAQMAQRAYMEKGAMDQEMMLKQAQRQREALGEYEGSVQTAYQNEQERLFQELSAKLAAEQAFQAEQALASQREEAEIYAQGQEDAAASGGKIICTELYQQGLMDKAIFEADQAFGKLQDADVIAGYHAWAETVVGWMKASQTVTRITYVIAMPWAKQMAYEMGVESKPNVIGKIMMTGGLPICRFIGKLKAKRVAHGY
jgi:hypothetical protein